MLSRFDDYLIHQSSRPLAHPVSGDRNFYDRFWLNGYSREADLYFGFALGLYPNRRVMDASLSVVREGRQHVLHASRRAPADRGETSVPPLSVEILEPLRALRLRAEPNEHGLAADLVFRARTPALEEPHLRLEQEGRVMMDWTRVTQFGAWEGALEVGGERLDLEPARVLGTKDRSWGIRPVGERETTPGPPPQFFFLWSPLQFEDVCTHFQVNEDAEGRPLHAHGALVPVVERAEELESARERIEPMKAVRHELRWRKGQRRVESARLALEPARGDAHRIELEPLLHFQMRGLGYLDLEWGHGMWKGEHAVGSDCWRLDELDPLDPRHVHVQQLCRARYGEREGLGILEQLAIGPHAPSGFRELLDPA